MPEKKGCKGFLPSQLISQRIFAPPGDLLGYSSFGRKYLARNLNLLFLMVTPRRDWLPSPTPASCERELDRGLACKGQK